MNSKTYTREVQYPKFIIYKHIVYYTREAQCPKFTIDKYNVYYTREVQCPKRFIYYLSMSLVILDTRCKA